MMSNREAIALLRNLEYALDSYCELNEEGKTAFRMAIESLELFGNSEHLPSVQPLIRCQDCKHHHYENGIPYCDRIDYGYGWKDDDFCSRAERREE